MRLRNRLGMDGDLSIDTLMDYLEIIDTVNHYALLLDGRDWHQYRQLFEDNIFVDFSSVDNAPSGAKNADEFVGAVKDGLGGFDTTQHMISNHAVTIYPDLDSDGKRAAQCSAYVQAQHYLPNDKGLDWLRLGGKYEFHLRQQPDRSWRINRLILQVLWNDGNWHVFSLARVLAANIQSIV